MHTFVYNLYGGKCSPGCMHANAFGTMYPRICWIFPTPSDTLYRRPRLCCCVIESIRHETRGHVAALKETRRMVANTAVTAAELLRLHTSQSGQTEWRFDDADTTASAGHQLGDGTWPLRLMEDKMAGRYLIASRDIAAGELVCAEDPFVQTVMDSLDDIVCHHCYDILDSNRVLFDGSPLEHKPSRKRGSAGQFQSCAKCAQVRYCSAACANQGAAAHNAECEVLQAIAASGNEKLKSGVRGLRLFIRLVRAASEDPKAFEAVEALAEHYTDAPAERRRFLEGVAQQINKLCPPQARMEPARLARLVSRAHTNLHAIADMAGVQYGSALYPRYGHLLNHSCSPNAAVSFHGRTWRLHTIRAVRKGQQVSISYTELYAGRAERRMHLKQTKAFECTCERCAAPPAEDAALDGWRCGACQGREGGLGAVPTSQAACVRCGTPHALAPGARAAIEGRWKDAIDEGLTGLKSNDEGRVAAGAADVALRAVEHVLGQSEKRVHERHALRHKARRLKVYALNSIGRPSVAVAAQLVTAVDEAREQMKSVLPPAHPEVAFFQHWQAKALWKQCAALADEKQGRGADAERARLHMGACEAASAAADSLAISHGQDHPIVLRWRSQASKKEP